METTKHSNDFRVWYQSLDVFQASLLGITCFTMAFSLVLNIEFRVCVFWHYIVIFVPLDGLWYLKQTDLREHSKSRELIGELGF